eukprot:scaffold58594_cov77-Cyclotella_meneghiniana.AAC.3
MEMEKKCLSIRILNRSGYCFRRLLAAFRYVARRSDDESPLLAAARAAEIAPKVDKRVFARLCLIHKETFFNGQEDLDISSGREIVAVVEQESTEEPTQNWTNEYTTFIDGLNWLHRKGFTKYEKANIDDAQCRINSPNYTD